MIGGVVPVLETPFHGDGSVDQQGFDRLAEHVFATGVDAVMFPAFASEFGKLADAERESLQRRLIGIADNAGKPVVVSVPDHATELAVVRARAAVDDGAAGLNVLPPFWLQPQRDQVLDHIRAVLSAVPDTPVIIQYAPVQTGSSLLLDDLRAVAATHGNLAGVKVESVPPGAMIQALHEGEPRLDSLVGYAGLFLPDAVRRGAIGVQPGCSFAELYVLLWRHHTAGNHDAFASLHSRMTPYLLAWMQHVELIVQVEKTISMRRGLIESDYCRKPSWTLSPFDLVDIDRFLDEFAAELQGAS